MSRKCVPEFPNLSIKRGRNTAEKDCDLRPISGSVGLKAHPVRGNGEEGTSKNSDQLLSIIVNKYVEKWEENEGVLKHENSNSSHRCQ